MSLSPKLSLVTHLPLYPQTWTMNSRQPSGLVSFLLRHLHWLPVAYGSKSRALSVVLSSQQSSWNLDPGPVVEDS